MPADCIMEQSTDKEAAGKKGRKVFLSVLGTSFYEPCVYRKGDFTASETRFIQRASLEYCGALEWESSDCVCIFLTDDARTNNWTVDGNARVRRDGDPSVPYRGLKDELEDMGLRASLQGISIPEGSSEDEIWKVFSCMYGALQDGDEVYLDITHGLRYLPMLAMVLLSYAKFLRHIRVRDIIYGCLNRESRTAQIVSLLPLSELQDWTSAADQFITAGSGEKLCSLYMPEVTQIRKNAALVSFPGEESPGKGSPRLSASIGLQRLLCSISLFCNEQLTCLGKDVVSGVTAERIRENLNIVKGAGRDTLPVAEPFIPILDRIGEAVEGYQPQSVRNIFLAASDCCRHGKYQQSLTFLLEGIVTFVAEKFGLDWGTESGRTCVNKIFSIIQNSRPDNGWEIPGVSDSEISRNRSVMRRMYESPAVRAVADDFSRITELRNQYRHCGMLKDAKFGPGKMLKDIEELAGRISYESLEEAFRIESESVFVNFTNHPSEKWSEEQLSAARAVGTVTDLKFPDIPTDIAPDSFDRLVEEYRHKILELCRGRKGTVHIQGEMTFVFRMVTELKARHIRCVASVTKRNTVDLGNGKSQSVFVFEGFREY